jgi:hypothetical protein
VEEDESRETLDVVAHHPAFAAIEDGDLRLRALYIALDNLLGEDDVERWIGGVDHCIDPVSPPVPYLELRARVRDLASRATRDRWAILKGQRDGMPVFVTTNLALKRIDHLLFDMHLTVALRILRPDENGLTTKEEGDVLNQIEDDLVAALGEHAVHVGRETCAGRRTVHLRVMEGGPARGVVDRFLGRFADREPVVTPHLDPRWDVVSQWR